MNDSHRPVYVSAARFLALVLMSALLAGAGVLVTELAAQPPAKTKPPEVEESAPAKMKEPPPVEDEDSKKPKHKVIRVGDENDPGKSAVPDAADLMTAARQAKNPAVRKFLLSIAQPHDLAVLRSGIQGYSGGKRIVPLKEYIGENPPRFSNTITLKLYKEDEWTADITWNANSGNLSEVVYYEQIVPNKVDEFLKEPLDENPNSKTYVSRFDMLAVAKAALEAALRWHESEDQQGRRQHERFDDMVAGLRKKILDVQVQQLDVLVNANDWDRAFALANALADAYPKLEDHQRIAGPLARVLGEAIKSGNYKADQLQALQRHLKQLELRFPNIPAFQPINEKLREQAADLFEQAKGLVDKSPAEALERLKRAEELYSRLPGLHDLRVKLDNTLSILRVGVRDLPVNLSPGAAVTDSEKQAVELLFDSLIKLSYDPDLGQHYVAGLAEGRPRLIPQGRQFQLDPGAYWSNEKPITAADIRNTVALLGNPRWAGHNASWAQLVDKVQVGADPYRVNLTLRQGFFDPVSLMMFKVLPMEPWPGHVLTAADEVRFSQHPVGSGPYQLQGPGQTKAGRPYVSFTANPSYGSRARTADLPRIHEIQFFPSADPVKDLQTGDLDLVADLPSAKVKAAQGLSNVKVLPPLRNRRIWFLAVNHRRRELQNPELRKALAHAIDREKILNEVFRADQGPTVHRALNGPYPAGSWACDAGLHYNLDVARRGIKQAEEAGLKSVHLTLKYANDDPRVKQALEAVKEQVAKEVGVTLDLQGLPPRELHDSVEGSHDYQLAYYHYDFPSEAYWLWPLFDPRATDDRGTNYLGYHNDSRLESLFQQVMGHCDFEQVRKSTQALHQLLFEKMPLIPLWQLDTHIVKAKDLKFDPVAPDVVRFDPVLVFTDVDQWRMEKK